VIAKKTVFNHLTKKLYRPKHLTLNSSKGENLSKMYIKEDSKSSRDSKIRNSKAGVLSISYLDGSKIKARMMNKLNK
jgi:hypothetical protein